MTTSKSSWLLGFAFAAANVCAQPGTDGATTARGQCDLTSLAPAQPWTIAARESVSTAVEQANRCIEQRDAACAETVLSPLDALTMTSNERAMSALPHAELANLRGDDGTAMAIHREALALAEVEPGLRREIATRLTLILNARGEPAEALRVADAVFGCDNWTGDALGLRAIAYENLGARTFALENFAAAFRLYEREKRAVPEAFMKRQKELEATEPRKPVEGTDLVLFVSGNPDYPASALRDDIDGWVMLEFEITDLGTLENVRVVASTHKVFEPNSIAAAQRWRYVPRFEGGLPLARGTERSVIRFCTEPCYFRRNPPPERGPDGKYATPSP